LVLAAVLLVLLAGAGVAVALPGRGPAPGPVVEQLTVGGHPVTLVVAPGRPGRNVVLAASAHGLPVSGGGPRTLPAGRSTITITVDGRTADVPVTVSGRRSRAADEECASRLLAERLAGRDAGTCRAPAAGDAAAAAAALVRHAGQTGIRAVAVRGDGTPRGRAAVRGALAAASGAVRVRADHAPPAPDEALLLVGSWAQARDLAASSAPGRGVLLAPWLLEPQVLAVARSQVTVATELAPTSAPARAYLAALAKDAPGFAPTGAGLLAFAGTGGPALQLWTPANVQFLPRFLGAGHEHGAHGTGPTWSPSGQLALVRANLPL
jgi:hypothetical protein